MNKMKNNKTVLILCIVALMLSSCSNSNENIVPSETPSVQITTETTNIPQTEQPKNEITDTPPTEKTETQKTYDDTLDGIEKYFSDKGLLSGERVKKEASMIGGIDGFAYIESDVEIYEYDVDSKEYKSLLAGEGVEIEGMDYIVTADAINGKFVLLSNNQKIIKAFNNFNK